jgi:hypothetical protein
VRVESGGSSVASTSDTAKVDKTTIRTQVFSGVGVALVTIFDSAGAVDAVATGALAATSLTGACAPSR